MKIGFKKEGWKFVAFGLLVVGLLVAGHHWDLHHRITLEGLRGAIEKTGRWQFAAFAGIYCVAALVPFPTVLLSTASGALWGPYLGTVMTVFSATLAACIPFFLSRMLGRGLVGKAVRKNPTATRCDRFAERNGFAAVLTMRLIPVVPWDLVNYLSGLCGIRFRDYLLASLIGTVPASFTYNLIGASLGEPIDKTKIALITVAVIGLAVFLYFRRRKSAAKVPPSSTPES